MPKISFRIREGSFAGSRFPQQGIKGLQAFFAVPLQRLATTEQLYKGRMLAWDDARKEFVRELRAMGVPLLVIVVSAEEIAGREAWLKVIMPGKVAEGLAAL